MPIGRERALRVLVVEDDPDIREILSLVLSSEGFIVEVVADVVSCIEQLHATYENEMVLPFDVLLLDLVLQGGHLGTEVLRPAAAPRAVAPAPGRRLYGTLWDPLG